MNAGEKFSLSPREKKPSGSMPKHSIFLTRPSLGKNHFPWVLSVYFFFLLKGLTDPAKGESLSSQLQALPGVGDTLNHSITVGCCATSHVGCEPMGERRCSAIQPSCLRTGHGAQKHWQSSHGLIKEQLHSQKTEQCLLRPCQPINVDSYKSFFPQFTMTGFQQRAWRTKHEGTRDLDHTNEDSEVTESKPLKKKEEKKGKASKAIE